MTLSRQAPAVLVSKKDERAKTMFSSCIRKLDRIGICQEPYTTSAVKQMKERRYWLPLAVGNRTEWNELKQIQYYK